LLLEVEHFWRKTLSVPTKTLTLKPRVETGTVRQSFSHGRTKQVVVEKRGKRRVGGDGPATETPIRLSRPRPGGAGQAPMTVPPPVDPGARRSGVVLRTLTEDEPRARQRACRRQVRDVEEAHGWRKEEAKAPQQQGRHRAGPSAKPPKPAAKAEEERHRQDEEAKPKGRTRSQERFGEPNQGRNVARAAVAWSRGARCRRDITDRG